MTVAQYSTNVSTAHDLAEHLSCFHTNQTTRTGPIKKALSST